jgi:DNA gyrase subunit A
MKLVEARGSLVGALVCDENDEVFAIASNGVVIRTKVADVRPTGRSTMGVGLMDLVEGDAVVAVARGEATDAEDDDLVEETGADTAETSELGDLSLAAEVDDDEATGPAPVAD